MRGREEEAFDELERMETMPTPVAVIEEAVVVGFDPKKLERLLGLRCTRGGCQKDRDLLSSSSWSLGDLQHLPLLVFLINSARVLRMGPSVFASGSRFSERENREVTLRKKGISAENGHFKENRPALLLLAGLALFTVLAAVSCGGTVGEQQRAGGPATQASAEKPQEAGAGLGHPSLGDEDAPVVLIEYADYQ